MQQQEQSSLVENKGQIESVRPVSRGIYYLVLLALLAGFVAGVFFLADFSGSHEFGERPVLVPAPPEIDIQAIKELLPRDAIQAIVEPQFETISKAAKFMKNDERVIGLVINGDSRAYPINILSAHEIVNDVVGGEPIAVTWCPLCYSALVFSRRVKASEDPLIFGVSGSLLYETLVMYDRQTDSLWSQLYGAAITGELDQTRLSFYPSTFTEWSLWSETNPTGLVLSKEKTCSQFNCGLYRGNAGGAYAIDPYESYYSTSDPGVINNNIPRSDDVLGTPKARILGIRVAGVAKAYPYAVLTGEGVVNDVLNGTPVLVSFDPQTQTATAFIREVDGRILNFSAAAGSPQILVDAETGSRWTPTSGLSLSGPLKNAQLTAAISTPAFAFAWYDYFPRSETYSP